MNPSVCICCGEPILPRGNVLSRNPNICGSCSSLVDGMDEPSIAFIPLSRREGAPLPKSSFATPGKTRVYHRRKG
jgi:hypothetical protein